MLLMLLAAALVRAADYVPGEVLVKFRPQTLSSELAQLRPRIVQRLVPLSVDRVVLPFGMTVGDALRRLRRDPTVQYAEPNYVVRIFDANDTYFSWQWDLRKVFAPEAWAICRGSASVRVAVLDTGADLTHPDLAGKIALSQNFVGPGPAEDGNGHGTHTAGTVAACTNNALGFASLGYDTRLMIGKVADDHGYSTVAAVAQGIAWAADSGASVVSMSLGLDASSEALRGAVDDAWRRGIVLVAAAGNSGQATRFYPAAYDHCIAVAATDELDRRCSFSTYGSWVHVAAPGRNIWSLYKRHGMASLSGTSMAAPHVAALAALLWANGGRSNQSIRAAIETSGDPTSGFGVYPAPRMNARRALLRLP